MPTRKHLPSPGSAPAHHDTSGMRFTVDKKGVIHRAPVKFGARKGDFLLWAVENHSDGPINVKVTDFQRKETIFSTKGTTPIQPIDWFATGDNVSLLPGETKVIGGVLNMDPVSGFPFFIDGVSYTIEVRSTSKPPDFDDIDYDPDGDIKP
jgi:hypothetical protein